MSSLPDAPYARSCVTIRGVSAGPIHRWSAPLTHGSSRAGPTRAGAGSRQLLTFVAVMLLAGLWMLKPQPAEHGASAPAQRAPIRIVLDGLLVGTLTGFVGVGGGFLIVPALVVLGGLGMQRAVASSLVIIAMKSFSGFAKYHDVLSEQGMELDWPVLGLFTGLGIVGSFAGGRVGRRLDQELLRRIFAWLLILMAVGMCVVAVFELVVPPADANRP